MSYTVFLGLGGNHDNSKELCEMALRKIARIAKKIVKTSSLYRTPPWGFEADNDFINLVVRIEYNGNPIQLLDEINSIEHELGRVRIGGGYSSRPIDIDILYFGNQHINTDRLQIPHPRMYDRKFVMFPLNEIAPFWVDPIKKINVYHLVNRCTDESNIDIY